MSPAQADQSHMIVENMIPHSMEQSQLKKPTVTQLVKKFPEGSLQYSQESATGLYPEPAESSPRLHILLPYPF